MVHLYLSCESIGLADLPEAVRSSWQGVPELPPELSQENTEHNWIHEGSFPYLNGSWIEETGIAAGKETKNIECSGSGVHLSRREWYKSVYFEWIFWMAELYPAESNNVKWKQNGWTKTELILIEKLSARTAGFGSCSMYGGTSSMPSPEDFWLPWMTTTIFRFHFGLVSLI